MSRDIVSQLKLGKKVEIEIDLKPDETFEQTDKNLQKLFLTRTKRALKNSLDSLLPPKMIPVFIGQTSINPDKQVNQISKEERQSINELIHHFNLTISRSRMIEEAIITGGGICTKEINPRTLSSKLVKNLFFAGEVIDVDGLTGGYNLQIAFSTGYLAGCSSLH